MVSQLSEVGSLDSQLALLLHHCASICKLDHLTCSMQSFLVSEGLALFDAKVWLLVCRPFSDCVLRLMFQTLTGCKFS